MFLQLRCKSIGETANITVTCPDDMETKVSVDVNAATATTDVKVYALQVIPLK